ncbi:MAG: TrbI/VirB10 family protein [Aulosira sp. ZfuCHP01]|nr:TrbI/VirB10 family protein [Aulosira sp. ZfuVER01]MDZ8000743.1 TrbI/VirB10 family protein [Aulosira sp. DedVER01a]MDZ8055051.1 TrbI/VirB10 family protein [Aulosira sp. ZfuCHP01]
MIIPSERPLKDLLTPQSEKSSLEVDSDEWELRIATLVGLEAESLSVDAEVVAESTNLQPSLTQPSEVKTEQSLSSNPFAKLGLVATATLAVVLIAGGFFSQLMSTNNQKPENNNIASLEIQPPTKKESSYQDFEGEVDTLKTKLALTQQAEAVKLAQQQLRSGKPISASQLAVKQNSQPDAFPYRRTVIQRIPTPISTVYVPQIKTVERLIRVPYTQQTRLSQPSLSPQPIGRKVTTQPLVNVTPPPTTNPIQESTRLANVGQASVTYQPHVNTTTPTNQINNQIPQSTINPQAEQTPRQQTSVVSQGVQQSPKSLAVGSHAKAVLATALFGETSKSTNSDKDSDNKNVFVVRLKEPLKTVDGAIAIPANTELLTEIRSLSEQGFLQLDVVKIVMNNNGNLSEKSLPQNAMMIRAPQGKPLIANQFPNRGSSILSMDIGLFVLGGLGKAAELSNRTESQVVTTNAGGTIISNTNPKRNILAGALEGGMNTVVPQIAQRNQQAISQMSQRTNVWFLPAGTAVEIYVNQVMQF